MQCVIQHVKSLIVTGYHSFVFGSFNIFPRLSHAYYVSKDLLDSYRGTWKDTIKKTNAKVILDDNETTLNIEETLTLNLGFKYGDKTRDEIADVKMCVIDMPENQLLLGYQI